MTPERIAELRKLCEEATKGPWFVESLSNNIIYCQKGNYIAQTWPRLKKDGSTDYLSVIYDTKFIAAARTALPELLDEVERLIAENKRLEEKRVALHKELVATLKEMSVREETI